MKMNKPCALAVIAVLFTGAHSAAAVEVQPHGARATALGGAAARGDGTSSLLANPGGLGFSDERSLWVDLAGDERYAFGFLRTGYRSSHGLHLAEWRGQAGTTERRLGFGVARTLEASGRFSLGLGLGARHLEQPGTDELEPMAAFGLGVRLPFAGRLAYSFGGSAVVEGDGADKSYQDLSLWLPAWSNRVALALGSRADADAANAQVQAGLELAGHHFHSTPPRLAGQPVRYFARASAGDLDTRFGFGLRWGPLGVDWATSNAAGTDDVLSLRTHWGAGWLEGRPRLTALRAELAGHVARAELQLREGDYLGCMTTCEAGLERAPEPRLEELREDALHLAQVERECDAAFGAPWDLVAIATSHSYGELLLSSPGHEKAKARSEVVHLTNMALNEIRSGRTERGISVLRESMRNEPDQVMAQYTGLKHLPHLVELQLETEPLFAVNYGSYKHRPLGRVLVVNRYPFELPASRLRFTIPGLGATPKNIEVQAVPPDSVMTVPLYAELNPALAMANSESRLFECEFRLVVEQFGGPWEFAGSGQLEVHGRNDLDWSQPERIASYVTPEDLAVREATGKITPAELAALTPCEIELPEPVAAVVTVQTLLQGMGMQYRSDPVRPAIRAAGGKSVMDKVQFAPETLRTRSGDCDDLVVLWASLLHAQGVEAMAALLPAHIMVLVDTGLPPSRRERLLELAPYAWEQAGRLWLPVETTRLDLSPFGAVQLGFHKLRQQAELAEVRWLPIKELHQDYPAATWPLEHPRIDWEPDGWQPRAAAGLREIYEGWCEEVAFGRGRRGGLPAWAAGLVPVVLLAQGQDRASDCARKNDRAVGRAINRLYDSARGGFEVALDCPSTHAAALNNLTNIELLQGGDLGECLRGYQSAALADPSDRRILYNVLNVLFVLESAGADVDSLEILETARAALDGGSAETALSEMGMLPHGQEVALEEQLSLDWRGLYHRMESQLAGEHEVPLRKVGGGVVNELAHVREHIPVYWKRVR